MTVVRRPCRYCHEGTNLRDYTPCTECDGTGGEWVPQRAAVALVCGHAARPALRLPTQHCDTCGIVVEVDTGDPAQLGRYADAMDAAADDAEGRELWGWPVPSMAERERLTDARAEWVARVRRAARDARRREQRAAAKAA